MNRLDLTFDSTLAGSACQIEVELLVDADGTDYDVLSATLVHLLPYTTRSGPRTVAQWVAEENTPPDFRACRELDIPLDPSEVINLYREEIENEMPRALAESRQEVLDWEAEGRELDFIESRP